MPSPRSSRAAWSETLGKGSSAVFLDRDGVINRKPSEGSYVLSWSEFQFLPGVCEAFRLLAEHNVLTIVVTNQRAVARGMLRAERLQSMHRRMRASVSQAGGRIDDVLVCEHESAICRCRKPDTGLFLIARERFPSIDFAASTVIGDSASDLEPGHVLGCRLVLVGPEERRRTELRRLEEKGIRTTMIAPSLLEAVRRYVLPTGPVLAT